MKKQEKKQKQPRSMKIKTRLKAGFVVEDLQIAKTSQQDYIVTKDLQDW